jgi:hypothetical protein
MPDINLKPHEYRQKRSILQRVSGASKRQLFAASALGAWVVIGPLVLKWVGLDWPPGALLAAGLAPGVLWLLWMALFD